jgi:hypothetical protein
MSITLTGTGGLFTRQGKFFQALRSANIYLGDTDLTGSETVPDAVGTSITDIYAQFASADQDVIDGLFTQRDSTRSALDGWKSYLKGRCEDALKKQVHRDVTLVDYTVEGALKELITQMSGSGGLYSPDNDVDASTVSATRTAASANTGDGNLVVSVLRTDGRTNELALAETLEALCDSDSQEGGTARNETWTVKGEPVASDPLKWDAPDGSGASATLTCVDATQDNAGGNLLTNSDFEDWTSNVPDNWTLLVGTAGTTIDDETVTIYDTDGTKSLEIIGDAGGTLTAIAQTFDSSDGTEAELEPNTVYQINFWCKKSASLAAGTLQIGLVDGSNNAINDDAGTANTYSLANGSITTSWVAYSYTFLTPRVLPTTIKLRVRVSVALTDGESVYIDNLAMAEATELYTGGPWVSIFSGLTDYVIGDKITIAVSNNYAGTIQTYFDRVFGMRELGLQLPSDTAGTETIADSLFS